MTSIKNQRQEFSNDQAFLLLQLAEDGRITINENLKDTLTNDLWDQKYKLERSIEKAKGKLDKFNSLLSIS